MEVLRDEVSESLLPLGKSDLILVCYQLKCKEPEMGGFQSLSRCALIRLAENTIDSTERGEDVELFMTYLKDLPSFVKPLNTEVVGQAVPSPQENSELEQLRQKYAQLQKGQAEALQLLQTKIDVAEELRL